MKRDTVPGLNINFFAKKLRKIEIQNPLLPQNPLLQRDIIQKISNHSSNLFPEERTGFNFKDD